MSGPIRRDASSDESNFVGATGGDPRVGRVDESNTQPPRRSLASGPVGATRRTTAERVESTVELCRSDKSTGRYDSKTRVGPRRVASGRAWNWLMSRRRLDGEFELIRLLLTEEGTEGVSSCVCPVSYRPTRAVTGVEAGAVSSAVSCVDSVWIVVAGDLWSRYYGPMLAQYHVHITR